MTDMRNIIPLMLIAAFALSVCGCTEKGPKKEVIATIGDYSLYKEDFLSELSLYPPEYRNKIPKEQLLNDIIEKKILLLEAQRQGLDRNPEFMKMVERFWEQSLLRSLLNKKSEEILSSMPQTEKDRNQKASGMIKSWIVDLERKTRIDINREALEKIRIK
ncbi:MAG: hypothetical protein A3F87_03905 [Omnitrophica WOR_2 bacterium RIFCSPLOWO2_12_FULL_51_24]|nr:MAG: hypothetical protein A2879_00955 [Omnitrophica WOR_2 bacterium RIFCSPHIGHO2_01_FULL_49_10]OGX35490.1 MAG: hypothetical protein A3I43_01200 [Omnitrophica WOR_2 bacterium RIFCSPLOWO2_02_FULL_50_19]OGX41538.1 MAG: hypothetical protein A3F87_03905 [Omnitrophica WOR_2 bacterium RIFCSPLOWO2_12_FULL_51_24]